MGKRKQTVPQRATEDKRKCLTWNMLDGAEGSVSVVADNDPSLQQETQDAGKPLSSNKSIGELSNNIVSFREDDLTEIFDLHVENCLYSITIQKEHSLKKESWSCVLAEFSVQFSPGPLFLPLPSELPDETPFSLYIGNEGEKSIFSFSCEQLTGKTSTNKGKNKQDNGEIKFWLVDVHLPVDCLQALRCKSFQVILERFNTDTMIMSMKILGTAAVLTKLDCPSQPCRPKGVNQSLLVLMEYFYRVMPPDYTDLPFSRKHDIDNLYCVIKQRHALDYRPILPDVQHPDLLPLLRLYQQAGISWMLHKERQADLSKTGDLHMLYTEVITRDGQTLYYNKHAGVLVRDRPLLSVPAPGGILGDEMGLGKTVEVLACILHHPRDCVTLPHPLPVVKDEEIIPPKRKVKERKKKIKKIKKKKKKTKKLIISDDSDSDTIIYSDINLSDFQNLSHDSDDQSQNKARSCDEVDKSDDKKMTLKGMQSEGYKMDETRETVVNGEVLKDSNVLEETSIKIDGELVNGHKEENNICDNMKDDDPLQDSDIYKSEKELNNSHLDEDSNFAGYKNIFTEMPASHREEFECICGSEKATTRGRRKKRLHPVQCVLCGLWQHAECVHYDLQDPYRGEFKCPHCHVASSPVVSGATLIISPFSIAHQWVDEILKHIAKESLNVFMYTGVNKQGFIQPQTLARQDIVITTYETLRKEIDYVDLPHSNSDKGRKLRYPKRFMALPSPIVAVNWWRVCLDEAQMVECTTTKTAEMALRLTAVNRWCVTGTPIQKDIDDLYGLMLFLGIDPYWVQAWWQKLVYQPFCHGIREPMYDLLTSVMWRTVKNDVLDQIDIPAQTEHTQLLTFSPVEEHFYRRQYRDCVKLSMERLSKWTDSSMQLSSLDRHTVNQLLYPLVRLRQACCHPQAVRGEFIPIQKSTMTMEELLESLTKKARLETEESHRALVASINGQAGLHIIRKEFVEAVEKYREVLMSVEEHKDRLHTDSLQQLHAMYNLQEILNSKPKGVAPTLRDGQLGKQITELKDKYMAKAIAYVKGTEEALAPVQIDVKQLQLEFKDGSEWWLEVIQWSVARVQDDILVMKVRDDLLDNRNPAVNNLVRSCRNYTGLQYAIESQLSGLHKAYQAVLKAMKGLRGPPSTELINQTVECCLRPVAEILKTCPFCKSEELFEVYEAKLFSFVEKGIEPTVDHTGIQVNTRRQGTWADSETEKALKSILNFAKSFRVPEDYIEYGTVHIKLFDAWKKEYRKMRTHWAGIKEHVGSFDELDMSTTRLRLRLPHEPVPETPQLNILEKSELNQHKLKLATDRIVANGELRKKLGQLLYLTNLAKNREDSKEGDNPEPCPICQTELGKEWSVMQCGHCYCLECIRILVERANFGRRNFSVKCAVCRQSTHHSEISYVTTKTEQENEDRDIRVLGSHSTKVEAIVRCLLKIQSNDPQAKSLVFSTWTDVLSVIATALDENNIKYKALYAAGKFQQNLSAFKQSDDVTTLLLPIHSGANGLNLIEATNVLLVEPILNSSQELQAIGRVHRIGQTKPTCVYRFLVRGTIEQKMQVLQKSMDSKSAPSNSEESGLTIGDLSSLFAQQLEDDNREGVQSMDESETPSPTNDLSGPNFGSEQGPSTIESNEDCCANNYSERCQTGNGCENNNSTRCKTDEEILNRCNTDTDIPSTSYGLPTSDSGSAATDTSLVIQPSSSAGKVLENTVPSTSQDDQFDTTHQQVTHCMKDVEVLTESESPIDSQQQVIDNDVPSTSSAVLLNTSPNDTTDRFTSSAGMPDASPNHVTDTFTSVAGTPDASPDHVTDTFTSSAGTLDASPNHTIDRFTSGAGTSYVSPNHTTDRFTSSAGTWDASQNHITDTFTSSAGTLNASPNHTTDRFTSGAGTSYVSPNHTTDRFTSSAGTWDASQNHITDTFTSSAGTLDASPNHTTDRFTSGAGTSYVSPNHTTDRFTSSAGTWDASQNHITDTFTSSAGTLDASPNHTTDRFTSGAGTPDASPNHVTDTFTSGAGTLDASPIHTTDGDSKKSEATES